MASYKFCERKKNKKAITIMQKGFMKVVSYVYNALSKWTRSIIHRMRTDRDIWFLAFSSIFGILLVGVISGIILASTQDWDILKQPLVLLGFLLLVALLVYTFKKVKELDKSFERRAEQRHKELIDEIRKLR